LKLKQNPFDGTSVMSVTQRQPHWWCNGSRARLSVVNCGFEPRSGQTKDYEIGFCCFSAKYRGLRRKS